MDLTDFGTVRNLFGSTFLWDIPRVTDEIKASLHSLLRSSKFRYSGNYWVLIMLKRAGCLPSFRLNLVPPIDEGRLCSHTYGMVIRDGEGQPVWNSPVIAYEFTGTNNYDTPDLDLPESSHWMAKGAISAGGNLSVFLTFYPGGEPDERDLSSEGQQENGEKILYLERKIEELEYVIVNLKLGDLERTIEELEDVLKRNDKKLRDLERKIELEDALANKKLRHLERKIEELKDAQSCAICLYNRRSVAFACGHSACESCAHILTKCHICRKSITLKLNIF